jgi:hypothetical protein
VKLAAGAGGVPLYVKVVGNGEGGGISFDNGMKLVVYFSDSRNVGFYQVHRGEGAIFEAVP